MNKKIKSGVFTFDENVAHLEYENKKVDETKSTNINEKKELKDKKKDFVSEILKEDPFFFTS